MNHLADMLGVRLQARRQSLHKLLAPLQSRRFNHDDEIVERTKVLTDAFIGLHVGRVSRCHGVSRGDELERGRRIPDAQER